MNTHKLSSICCTKHCVSALPVRNHATTGNRLRSRQTFVKQAALTSLADLLPLVSTQSQRNSCNFPRRCLIIDPRNDFNSRQRGNAPPVSVSKSFFAYSANSHMKETPPSTSTNFITSLTCSAAGPTV